MATGSTPGGEPLVVVGALALAVGSAVVALHLAPWLGAVVTQRRRGRRRVPSAARSCRTSTSVPGCVLGLAVGVLVATLHALFDELPSLERRWPSLAAVTLPVTVTGTLVYVVGRVLVGDVRNVLLSSPCWRSPPGSGSGGGRATAGTRAVDPGAARAGAPHGPTGRHTRLTAAEIGAPLGHRATFVQFSSEVCAPCRRTAAVLGQLVSEPGDLSHVEMDVVEHLDLVRRFSIMRTPTILLLDARGVVVGRLSGATDRRHALSALEACPGGVSAP